MTLEQGYLDMPMRRREYERFLASNGLGFDADMEYAVCLKEGGEVIAAGALAGRVLKGLAVADSRRGEGLLAMVVSELMQQAAAFGRSPLYIYTKPVYEKQFLDMGFHTVHINDSVLFMSDRRGGLEAFIRSCRNAAPSQALEAGRTVGAVVANCDPFTFGHLHLVTRAAEECGWLHLFILSDERSRFSAARRYEMAKAATEGLGNVICHPASDFIISAATFPAYFFKDKVSADAAFFRLDLELFGSKIAPALNISRRYVGTEPYCAVTAAYNLGMADILPRYGISLHEVPRLCFEGSAVSASTVRRLLDEGRLADARALLPPQVRGMLGEG